MFTSLFSVYQKLKRPSSLFWVNVWSYSTMNSWVFMSNELLSFYITSINGFKSVTTTSSQLYPQVLYKISFGAIALIHFGFLIG